MKLPYNALLVLVSVAAFGGIVYSVFDQMKAKEVYAQQRKQIKTRFENLKAKGVGAQPSNKTWTYNADLFTRFAKANFTGWVPKKVEVKDDTPEPTGPTVDPDLDMTSLLEVAAVAVGGDDTRVVLRYKKEVEPPENLLRKDAPAVSSSSIPRGRRGSPLARPGQPAMPAMGMSLNLPPHLIQLGEKLWSPYSHIILADVDPDAAFVVFEIQIEKKKDKDGKFPRQKVYLGTLQLPAETMEALVSGGVTRGGGEQPERQPRQAEEQMPDLWRPVKETLQEDTSDGFRVIYSEQDQRFLQENAERVFNKEIAMSDYSSGSGSSRVRGIQLRTVSPRMRKFGVQAGDVIIELNNQPVKGIAAAKKLGKNLYKKGVRSFTAKVQRMGRVITVSHHFKK